MRYLGGKFKSAKGIVDAIRSIEGYDKIVYEPFCGGLHITQRLLPNYASDINQPLIALYKALQEGSLILPEQLTKEQYLQVKEKMDLSDPMTGFCGAACGYGGMWFSSFIPKNVGEGKRSLEATFKIIQKKVQFSCVPYDEIEYQNGSLVYCDPPYNNTSQSYFKENFDSEKFYEWVRKMEIDKNCSVYVSEWSAPEDFQTIWRQGMKLGLHSKDDKIRIEKLYRWRNPKREEIKLELENFV